MSSGNCGLIRLSWLAVALIAALWAAAFSSVSAQDFPSPRGGDARPGGGVSGGDVRGGGGGIGTGIGIGIGAGVGIGVGQEIMRQQDRGPNQPSTQYGTTIRKQTQKAATVTPPKTPFIYRTPDATNCHQCDKLLAAIMKLQGKIARDEEKVESMKASRLSTAAAGNDLESIDLENSIKAATQSIAKEKAELENLIAQYKKCLQEYHTVCPAEPKRHRALIDTTNVGDPLPDFPIDCDKHKGKITVRTGVDIHWIKIATGMPTDLKGVVRIGYSGTGCDDCYWVQFVWTEVLVKQAGKDKAEAVEGTVTTTAGSYDLTTNPYQPNYAVDSASPTDPSLEAVGTANVGDGYDNVFDMPGNPFEDNEGNTILPPPVQNAKQTFPNLENITWADHFDTYLICDGRVCATVSWQASYVWKPGQPDTVTGPIVPKPTISAGGKPTSGQYDALAGKYPAE